MKRSILTTLLMLIVLIGQAQEKKTQSYQLKGANKISLQFEYPQIIKIKTWDKNEVQIISYLDINNGKDNENFVLKERSKGSKFSIVSELKGLDRYDNVHMVGRDRDSDDDDNITITRNGRTITSDKKGIRTRGVEVLIELEVYVPKNIPLEIEAKFGLVEVINSPDELEIMAKFGGADVSIKEDDLSYLSATTSWGRVFSNLNKKFKFKGDDMIGKEMRAEISESNRGSSIKVETEFGNVFLRKN
ncbi:hypothetical protein [Roseivirga sp.]|uniref:hypothetical protein n=1 Tax=Roseivirga sp. TaxID=1964215 RepID=UPI003B8AED39